MATTKIEWARKSWNPISGCSPISEGCEHCYARRMAQRLKGRYGYPANDPFRVTFHPDKLNEPLKWKKPSRIFVCSMGDLFHEHVKTEWIDKVFLEMVSNSRHKFLVLTKRPQRLLDYVSGEIRIHTTGFGGFGGPYFIKQKGPWNGKHFDNIWLGVTCENQQRADERIPILLQIPAAVRFVSLEPMLGPIDLSRYLPEPADAIPFRLHDDVLQWSIVGGETGPGARPMHPDWVRSVRDQCQEAGVPFFFKRHGDYNKKAQGLQYISDLTNTGRLLDGRLWEEYPE